MEQECPNCHNVADPIIDFIPADGDKPRMASQCPICGYYEDRPTTEA